MYQPPTLACLQCFYSESHHKDWLIEQITLTLVPVSF